MACKKVCTGSRCQLREIMNLDTHVTRISETKLWHSDCAAGPVSGSPHIIYSTVAGTARPGESREPSPSTAHTTLSPCPRQPSHANPKRSRRQTRLQKRWPRCVPPARARPKHPHKGQGHRQPPSYLMRPRRTRSHQCVLAACGCCVVPRIWPNKPPNCPVQPHG
jgi:hypothetical protein